MKNCERRTEHDAKDSDVFIWLRKVRSRANDHIGMVSDLFEIKTQNCRKCEKLAYTDSLPK